MNKTIGIMFSFSRLDSFFSSYFELLQVSEKLCRMLAERVTKQLSNPSRRQMMFSLLGEDFVQRYFSHLENDPSLLVIVIVYLNNIYVSLRI